MANEQQPEWQEMKPLEISRAEPAAGNQGNRKPGRRPKRGAGALARAAASLQLDDLITLWRVDLARMMWGNGRAKSTILVALQKGNLAPDAMPQVPAISSQQAYVYYHRMMQELQADHTLKSVAQKNAEARARLEALGKAAQAAGEYEAARRIFADLALIERTPNPTTAARVVGVFAPNDGGDGGQGTAPAIEAPAMRRLNREQLQALATTGKLPAPRG